jgi:hypothetical protein
VIPVDLPRLVAGQRTWITSLPRTLCVVSGHSQLLRRSRACLCVHSGAMRRRLQRISASQRLPGRTGGQGISAIPRRPFLLRPLTEVFTSKANWVLLRSDLQGQHTTTLALTEHATRSSMTGRASARAQLLHCTVPGASGCRQQRSRYYLLTAHMAYRG